MFAWLRGRFQSESLLITFGALILALLRSPLLLFHGRVNAEEGTVYLQQAWDFPPLRALELPHQGYYSLLMNALGLLTARVFPLEWAAVIFAWAALLILLMTVYLAASCEAFHNGHTRLGAAAVCVFTPAIEVWLTAEDAQFYLVVCVALICISSELRHRLLRNTMLLVAGLTGPVSCILTPFFWYRAWRRRTAGAWIQAAILTVCSTLQGVVLLNSIRVGQRALVTSTKLEWFGPVLVLKIFSVTFFTRLGALFAQRIVIRHTNIYVCLLFWIIFFLVCALFWKMAVLAGEPGKMCFGMALTSLLFNYIGIAEPLDVVFIGAFRYFFPGLALFWMVLALAHGAYAQAGAATTRKAAYSLIWLALFCGVIDSVGYWKRFQRLDPRWSGQVVAWRRDPLTPIRVAPSTWPKVLHLSAHRDE